MYGLIKIFIKKIFPGKTLFRIEPFLRNVYSVFNSGNKYECSICSKKLRTFINLTADSGLCPKCGSLPRDRRLWVLLDSEMIKPGMKILDFSPSRCLYRKLSRITSINYTATDLSGNFLADKKFDITKIDAPEDSFDLIICYHILEHIEDDISAMIELKRVLKPLGKCLIQTPFKVGDIFENTDVKSDAASLKHFGQKDHIRIYSVIGLKKRLESCGFKVEIKEFTELQDNKYGLMKEEVTLICN